MDGDTHRRLAAGAGLAAPAPGAELLAGAHAEPDDGEAPFTAWLHEQRSRQCQAAVARQRGAVAAAESAGWFDEALAHTQAWAQQEPLDEAAQQAPMRLHDLRAELGVEPAAPMREQAALLRRRQAPSAGAPALALHPMRATLLQRPPRLVGRAGLLAAVQAAWAAGQAPWLEGTAGLGRTRLLAEPGRSVQHMQEAMTLTHIQFSRGRKSSERSWLGRASAIRPAACRDNRIKASREEIAASPQGARKAEHCWR